MRRVGLLAWPLALCYFGFAITVLAKDGSETDDVRLRVSIRKDSLKQVPSSQHTFSQLELLNLHPTESIMIHSIQTAPEETILIRSVSGQISSSTWDNIPQQFHVSRLPSGSLSLGPGQVAIVPLTFLPRYPDSTDDNYILSTERKAPPVLSSAARVDLMDLIGETVLASFDQQKHLSELRTSSPRRRSNLDPSALPAADEFEVKTSIVVDTSRGVLQMPISATSIRENSYSIPDIIRFYHSNPRRDTQAKNNLGSKASPASLASIAPDGTLLLNSVPFYATEKKTHSKTRLLKRSDPARDCYDIFINNPSFDTDLEISEILVSRPDLMSVEFDPTRLLLPPDLLVLPSLPAQGIREWTEEGPMFVPADSVDNYIATVCTAPNGVQEDPIAVTYLEEMSNWIDTGNFDLSLGFLQIRTDTETLFISLERYSQHEETNQVLPIDEARTGNTFSLTSSSKQSTSLLQATPKELKFTLLSSASPPVSHTISLQNKSPVAIRIMRVSITLDGQDDNKGVIEDAKSIGLRINATKGDGEGSDEISPASSVANAVRVTCQINTIASSMRSYSFTGSIVIRGTMDTELQYDEWKGETMRNPYRDYHLTVEVPYSIFILNGRIEVTLERSTHPYPQIFGAQPWDRSGRAVSTLFFPLSRFDATDDFESPLPTQKYMSSREISHDLRIMTNMALSLSLESADIVDENGLAVDGTQSPCSRFNVSRSRRFETSTDYPDFVDLGFLSLHYKFDTPKKNSRKEGRDNIIPTTCFLNIFTSPAETGIHRIPLIVFPAELQIMSPARSVTRHIIPSSDRDVQTDDGSKHRETVEVGSDKLLGWLRSSEVGQAFLKSLESIIEKKNRSTSQLLSKYLKSLLRLSAGVDLAGVKPILLKIGAIEHGEIAKVPLLFTNYNPISITLSMDVDEVEGMTMDLARDASRGHGDGNNIFDFLPKSNDANARSEDAIITEGHFRGHPVYGLRQFLLSNPHALEFSSLFPFRDAIFMSKEAIETLPFLKHIYHWHSYAKFHRNDQREYKSEVCDLSVQKWSRRVDESSKDQLLPGPMIVSSDQSLLRPLQVCIANTSRPRNIVIPPGGSARFDVRLRSPPLDFLDNDISQVLATGLVLSTSFGQTLPIFATFEALQGQLQLRKPVALAGILTEDSSVVPSSKEDVIRVPLGLQWQPSIHNENSFHFVSVSVPQAPLNSDPTMADSGFPLHVTSSFSREVRLLSVESCNPWFYVALRNSSNGIYVGMDTGTYIGSLHSAASCHPDRGAILAYPSFYQCILNWLSKRHELQPTGCGLKGMHTSSTRRKVEESGMDNHRGLRGIFQAFESVISGTQEKFNINNFRDSFALNSTAINSAFQLQPKGTSAIKSGVKRTNGYIDVASLNAYADAWDAWQVADGMGLTSLSSNLRATIEYYPTLVDTKAENDTAEYQSLSLSMHDLGIQSILSPPKLVDTNNEVDTTSTENASVLHFPATLVGSVSWLKIPLKNPTSVPVRVRLAAASPAPDAETLTHQKKLRDRFMNGLESPYVQNGSGYNIDEESGNPLWWEGGGAFFLADSLGDVIRSHHNISIKGGAGAHVSLVNPSLQSVSAFVLGCGGRCGIRDESTTGEGASDMKQFSVIGAAAATSITLVGRQRSPLPQLNELSSDEPFIYAGGTPVPGSSGPRAFAIPFSSLDEIILPPYGTGEIGPIFFRPPGRSLAIGCDTVKQSDSGFWGVDAGNLCRAEMFSSMVFLENSLTGMERVELRGKSMWDRLYFLDPPARDNADSFGDIELRNGRSTLVFSGSGIAGTNDDQWWNVKPVIKQVLLHNGGDRSVVVKSMYLSDTHKLAEKSWRKIRTSGSACRKGNFRLLDCWESDRLIYIVDGNPVVNVHAGFVLEPGESRSLYIEHAADCKKLEEFVSINIDYIGMWQSTTQDRRYDVWMSHDTKTNGPLHIKKVDLVVGYSMDQLQARKCLPVNWWYGDVVVHENTPDDKAGISRYRKVVRGRYRGRSHWSTKYLLLLVFVSLVVLASTMITELVRLRRRTLERAISRTKNSHRDEAKFGTEKKRPSQQSLWNATFRCLARADPTSPELQALGREQIKQVVACRYRAKGGSPPASLINAGVFIRERIGIIAPSGNPRQRVGKEGGGSERVRTLSDALFRTFSSEHGDSVRLLIPAGLGWRVAFASSIINDNSIQSSAIVMKTDKLLERRTRGSVSDQTPDLLDGCGSDSESFEIDNDVKIETLDTHKGPPSPSLQPTKKENQIPEVVETITGDESIVTELWTKKQPKKYEKSQTEPSIHEGISPQTNGRRSIQPKSVINPLGAVSPTTSIHSSESSSKDKKKTVRNSQSKPHTTKSNSALTARQITVTTSSRHSVEHTHKAKKEVVKSLKQDDSPEDLKETHLAARLESSNVPQSQYKQSFSEDDFSRVDKRPKTHFDTIMTNDNATIDRSKHPMLPPGVLPPPGLAPPPGFNHETIPGVLLSPSFEMPSSPAADSSLFENMIGVTLNSGLGNLTGVSTSPSLSFPPHVNADLLFGTSLETRTGTPVGEGDGLGFRVHSSPPIGQHEGQLATAGDPLLDVLLNERESSHNGFDVMDFLGSILDDGGTVEQGGDQNLASSGLLAGASGVILASNPWASEHRSRASAYGIEFDDSDGGYDTNPGPIPLLTPAAILLAGQEDDGDDDERAFSFYASLTDED